MELPSKPSPEDCCNSGCNPCVFDVYNRQLKLYRDNKETLVISPKNGISESQYTVFFIVSTLLLSDSQKIIRFKRNNQNMTKVWWRPGDHFLFKFNRDCLSCTRAYTPFKLMSETNYSFDFSIVLKRYANGLVSSYLFELQEGDLTLWRGPYGSFKIQSNTFNRIIMVAQGTGIAPYISIIESILSNEDDMNKIVLRYCCKSINDILFRDELKSYSSYWNFSYKIFLACIPSNANIRYQEPIINRRFTQEDINELKPFFNDQFLICGSSLFTKNYCDILQNQDVLSENIFIF